MDEEMRKKFYTAESLLIMMNFTGSWASRGMNKDLLDELKKDMAEAIAKAYEDGFKDGMKGAQLLKE